jgi:hypothetical protein
MTRLSRPYQIALAAIGLFAAVWLIALRGHSGSSSPSSASSTPPAAQPAASAGGSSAATTPYTGSAPGVAGLTRAIEKARGAVGVSEANAKQLAEKSAQASSATASPSAGASAAGAAAAHASSNSTAAPTHTTTRVTVHARTHRASTRAPAARSDLLAALSPERAVEADLQQGKVVAILFWNARAPVDQAVHAELAAAARSLHGHLAVISAGAKHVGDFGTFTRAVQVYATPTILFVNRRGQTSSLTGLTDVYALEQAIAEASR